MYLKYRNEKNKIKLKLNKKNSKFNTFLTS